MLCALFLLPLFLLAKNFKDCQKWAIKLMECVYSLSLYIFANGKNVASLRVYCPGVQVNGRKGEKSCFYFY